MDNSPVDGRAGGMTKNNQSQEGRRPPQPVITFNKDVPLNQARMAAVSDSDVQPQPKPTLFDAPQGKKNNRRKQRGNKFSGKNKDLQVSLFDAISKAQGEVDAKIDKAKEEKPEPGPPPQPKTNWDCPPTPEGWAEPPISKEFYARFSPEEVKAYWKGIFTQNVNNKLMLDNINHHRQEPLLLVEPLEESHLADPQALSPMDKTDAFVTAATFTASSVLLPSFVPPSARGLLTVGAASLAVYGKRMLLGKPSIVRKTLCTMFVREPIDVADFVTRFGCPSHMDILLNKDKRMKHDAFVFLDERMGFADDAIRHDRMEASLGSLDPLATRSYTATMLQYFVTFECEIEANSSGFKQLRLEPTTLRQGRADLCLLMMALAPRVSTVRTALDASVVIDSVVSKVLATGVNQLKMWTDGIIGDTKLLLHRVATFNGTRSRSGEIVSPHLN